MSRIVGKNDQGQDIRAYDFADSKVITKAADLTDFQIEMVATTETVDRDQEVLALDGWKLANYKKNPVILLSHNYYEPPIAKALKVWISDGKMHVKIEFPEDGLYAVSDVIRKLYKADFMRAGSIGFLPIKWEYGDGKNTPYWRKFTEQEMLEYSLVAMPANPDALVEGKSGFREAKNAGIIEVAEFDLISKAVHNAVEKELKSGITIFVPKTLDVGTQVRKKDGDQNDDEKTGQDDGHVDDTQHSDTPAASTENPENTQTGDNPQPEKTEDDEKGLTEAQKKYRREMKSVIEKMLPDLVKDQIKALIDEAVEKGYNKEAILHYSEILLGDRSDKDSQSPTEPDQLSDAIKAGVSEGLAKR